MNISQKRFHTPINKRLVFVSKLIHPKYARPLHVQKFIAEMKQRLAGNRLYNITDEHPAGLVAMELGTRRIIMFKTMFHQQRNWAILTIKWIGTEPTVTDLDRIRDDFFGKDVHTLIQLSFNTTPYTAQIIHCLDDNFIPGGNGE